MHRLKSIFIRKNDINHIIKTAEAFISKAVSIDCIIIVNLQLLALYLLLDGVVF